MEVYKFSNCLIAIFILIIASDTVEAYNCYECICRLCGDPQLTTCDGVNTHLGLEPGKAYRNVSMMHLFGNPIFQMGAKVDLSHVDGAPPNHIQVDSFHGQFTKGPSGVSYMINNTGLYLGKIFESRKSALEYVPRLETPNWATEYISVYKNNPGCIEFNALRSDTLADVEVRYCSGCINIIAPEDLNRHGVCMHDIPYSGHDMC